MHLGLPHSSASKDAQQQDSKEARRLFRENIRTDWNYPPLPQYLTQRDHAQSKAEHGKIAGFKIHEATPEPLLDQIIPEVIEWTEREYGSSDSEPEDGAPGASAQVTKESDSVVGYLFEGPDSVGEQIMSRAQARKRKRQKLLAEEMQWNDGLKHFISRRDIWTGAKPESQVHQLGTGVRKSAISSIADAYNASIPSSPRSSSSMNTDTSMPSRPSTATTSPDPMAMSAAKAPSLLLPDVFIPTMSRLLTNHPVRKKIGPSMYSEIYSKIILQSRTPAVPINLSSLIKALVQGWQSDGEWPPKISVPEPSVARKKAATGIKQGVKAVTRVLKITGSSDTYTEKKPD